MSKIVEIAKNKDIYKRHLHPYTEALLNAVPGLEIKSATPKFKICGDIPNPSNPPQGCAFQTRCPLKEKQCEEMQPALKEVASGHLVACFLKER